MSGDPVSVFLSETTTNIQKHLEVFLFYKNDNLFIFPPFYLLLYYCHVLELNKDKMKYLGYFKPRGPDVSDPVENGETREPTCDLIPE